MTTLLVENLAEPTSTRAARTLEFAWQRMLAELAGRTVWCVSASSAGSQAADRLYRRLQDTASEEMYPGRFTLSPGQASPDEPLTRAQVAAEDIVVLHDPRAAALAAPARDCRSHVIWRLPVSRFRGARSVPHPQALAVDGFVMTSRDQVAAVMPGPAVLAVKAVAQGFEGGRYVAVASLLADVVRFGRAESVGGTLQARPSVAAR
jgi:hypothetical protein